MASMPDRSVCLTLLADPTASRADAKVVGFGGVAYSGGVVPNHGWNGDMAIDLASLSLPSGDVPVLRNHDPNQIVGRARLLNDGSQLTITEGRFSDVTDVGREVAALMGEGHPWALSIGINGTLKSCDKKKPIEMNGRSMAVDAAFRNSRVLELSFVPSGADPNAYAAQLSSRHGIQPPDNGDNMNEQEQAKARIAELEAQIVTLTTERDGARTELAAAQTNLAAQATAARNARLTALFGAEPNLTDAQLDVYRSMTDDQFAAVEALAATAAVSGDLFRQTATKGRDADGGGAPAEFTAPIGYSVDSERVQLHSKALQYQIDHPGTNYLTAVNAVAA
jgi:hypothetical protein